MDLVRFFISIASIPQRLHLVDRTVISFARQTRPPERVLLVLPYRYTRWPLLRPNLTLVHPHPLLEFHRCPTDDGPGTKSLCALPRLAALLGISSARHHSSSVPPPSSLELAMLVLADDDREYKPSALELIEGAALHARSVDREARAARMTRAATDDDTGRLGVSRGSPPLRARAFSFQANPLPNSNVGNHTPSLIVGQGADLVQATWRPDPKRARRHTDDATRPHATCARLLTLTVLLALLLDLASTTVCAAARGPLRAPPRVDHGHGRHARLLRAERGGRSRLLLPRRCVDVELPAGCDGGGGLPGYHGRQWGRRRQRLGPDSRTTAIHGACAWLAGDVVYGAAALRRQRDA